MTEIEILLVEYIALDPVVPLLPKPWSGTDLTRIVRDVLDGKEGPQ